MQPPPWMLNPFLGVYNPAFPHPTGAVAGTYNAFGWFRSVFAVAIPEYIGDMDYYRSLNPGVLV